ncbi:DddA-like double-stranded DNA deaminase toxin [Glycomyces sp. NPDC047010]|uniref:DddA-like double-stranded DNA deaminase toxin n=1 Tax=Glycomyces sp. NPDC047010 TaxID=3155023 RepID=UPI0033D26029
MASIGDVAAALRAAVATAEKAAHQLRSADEQLESTLAPLQAALADSANRDAHDGLASLTTARERLAEALATLKAGSDRMGDYIASTAGGGGGGAPPPTAPRTTADGGGSVPPRAREAAGRLPVWTDGDRARAVAFTGDESELVDFQSGRDPKSREGVKPPFKYAVVMDHVEARIAGEIRAGGSRDVTMVINKEPCGGEAGCDAILPAILPEGARLTVYVGDSSGVRFYKTYNGNGTAVSA